MRPLFGLLLIVIATACTTPTPSSNSTSTTTVGVGVSVSELSDRATKLKTTLEARDADSALASAEGISCIFQIKNAEDPKVRSTFAAADFKVTAATAVGNLVRLGLTTNTGDSLWTYCIVEGGEKLLLDRLRRIFSL